MKDKVDDDEKMPDYDEITKQLMAGKYRNMRVHFEVYKVLLRLRWHHVRIYEFVPALLPN